MRRVDRHGIVAVLQVEGYASRRIWPNRRAARDDVDLADGARVAGREDHHAQRKGELEDEALLALVVEQIDLVEPLLVDCERDVVPKLGRQVAQQPVAGGVASQVDAAEDGTNPAIVWVSKRTGGERKEARRGAA